MAKVNFIEDGHKYIDEFGKQYTSVTTIIGKYKAPFDAEYWSLYKAIERIVVKKQGEDYFKRIKKEVGYEKIIPYFLPKIQTPNLLENTIEEIKEEWRIKKEEACTNGTKYHKEQEDKTNSQIICTTTGLPVIQFENRNFHELKDGVYSELVVWNEEVNIAGQADKVIIDRGFVDIDDYKTSKVIAEQSFYHYLRGYDMMQYPLDNIMDCNKMHYTIQLSIYGWMLERKGFTVRKLRIYHTITDRWIEVKYLKDEVEYLLSHFKTNG